MEKTKGFELLNPIQCTLRCRELTFNKSQFEIHNEPTSWLQNLAFAAIRKRKQKTAGPGFILPRKALFGLFRSTFILRCFRLIIMALNYEICWVLTLFYSRLITLGFDKYKNHYRVGLISSLGVRRKFAAKKLFVFWEKPRVSSLPI